MHLFKAEVPISSNHEDLFKMSNNLAEPHKCIWGFNGRPNDWENILTNQQLLWIQ